MQTRSELDGGGWFGILVAANMRIAQHSPIILAFSIMGARIGLSGPGWRPHSLWGRSGGIYLDIQGGRSAYFAGDTAIFSDMKLYADIYKPEMAFLPVGDHFTMGPEEAAYAGRMLGVKEIIPMHYGTFPLLTGHPEELEKKLAGSGIRVRTLQGGSS